MLFECRVPDEYEAVTGMHLNPSQLDTVRANPLKDAYRFQWAYCAILARRGTPYYLGFIDGQTAARDIREPSTSER